MSRAPLTLLTFACVLVAHFAAAAVERCEPALREQPLAVITQAANIKTLVDANAAARERNVRPGMTETICCPHPEA